MVRILDEFPSVHQTFNVVPSMLMQVEEYASGQASDPFLRCALKPAESLTEEEQSFILRYFFQANPSRIIYRYPRYGELYDAWQGTGRNPALARRMFGAQAWRDLQVLSQLAWFDEDSLRDDREIQELVLKGRDYTLRRPGPAGAKADRVPGDRAARLSGTGLARADRNLHHAFLPPHPAAAVRLERRRDRAPAPAASQPLSLRGRRPAPA